MNKRLKENIKQKIYYKNIDGTKCYVIKKKGFEEKQAMVMFKYGSKDVYYSLDRKSFTSPFGTAHFLEHKLFDNKDSNVFEEFSKLGASSNAFTNFNNTAYYFKTRDNFYESLDIILNMVSTPYFTDKSVEKEKGIIEQEIKMYDDNPFWCGYFNLLKLMYEKNGVRENIAGSVEDIKKIDKDILYDCYESFYTKNNAVVVCCGDIDKDKTFERIEKNLKLNAEKNVKIENPKEDAFFMKDFVSKKMNVGQNIFNIGFKETQFSDTIIDRINETKILLDIICGRSSKLYNEMYNKGIIDEGFGYEYSLDFGYGFCAFSGGSSSAEQVKAMLLERIEELKAKGINENEVEKIKGKHLGEFIRGFNSIDNIVNAQAELATKGTGLSEALKAIKATDAEKINQRLISLFNSDCALSLIEKEN